MLNKNYHLKKWFVLSLMCLLLTVTGCGKERVKTDTKTQRVCPSSVLYQQYAYEEFIGDSWEDLFDYTLGLLDIIDKHNNDKTTIGEYCDGNPKTQGASR